MSQILVDDSLSVWLLARRVEVVVVLAPAAMDEKEGAKAVARGTDAMAKLAVRPNVVTFILARFQRMCGMPKTKAKRG